jgi:hypothetical protein
MAIENLSGKPESSNVQNFTWFSNEMLYEMQQAPKTVSELIKETYMKNRIKHKRGIACKLIGFPGSSPNFTLWLKENEFLSEDDCPHHLLIDECLMDFKAKSIYSQPQYNSCGRVISGSEYESGRYLKSVYTPLFFDKGIEYFKKLLADPLLLKEETERLKLHNRISYLKLNGIFENE